MSSFLQLFTYICAFYCNLWLVQGVIRTDFSANYFDGLFAYIPVRRSMIQARLDAINSQSADNDVKFFLPPEGTVFPDLLKRDQHVVLIVYGDVIATSFEESMTSAQKESFSTRSDTLIFDIPFLTSKPGEEPQFTLLLSRYTSTRTEFIDPNFAVSSKIPADELLYISNQSQINLSFSHGEKLKLKMSGQVSESCRKPADKIVTDFSKFLDELQISQQLPDFSICERLGDIDVDFCNAWGRYGEDIRESGSNVCQFWTHSAKVTTCQLSIKITEMSDGIRDMLALSHVDVPEIIEAETQRGFYGIGLAAPCV